MMTDTSPLELVAEGCEEMHDWLDAVELLLDFLAERNLSPDSDIPAEMAANAVGDGEGGLPGLSGHLDHWINWLHEQRALTERHPQLQRMIAQVLDRVVTLSDRWIYGCIEAGLITD